jgi:hypothetical protein
MTRDVDVGDGVRVHALSLHLNVHEQEQNSHDDEKLYEDPVLGR